MNIIDFSYSYAPTHTMALSRPSSSEKFLADIGPERLRIQYSYGNLRHVPILAWDAPKINVETELTLWDDRNAMPFTGWKRHDSGAPCLLAEAGNAVRCVLTGIATRIGVVLKCSFQNNDSSCHSVSAKFSSLRGWVISNKGWIDGVHNNVLLTMNDGRADRFVAFAEGADEYPMFRNGIAYEASAPMPDAIAGEQRNSMKFMTALLNLEPKASRAFHIVMPFEAYWREYDSLRSLDFDVLMDEAIAEWTTLLDRGCRVATPDTAFNKCFRACLADVFVMREEVPNHAFGISPGTNVYRSMNCGEGLMAEVLLDRMGYCDEATMDLPNYLMAQNADGCWAYEGGWEHEMWCAIYWKCLAAMQHYRFSGDLEFLKKIYPRMRRAALFNATARKSTLDDPDEAFRGLMPRGMGDCGMMNNGDYYGAFYPMSCLAAAADRLVQKAAKILGYEDDVQMLETICTDAEEAVRRSLRANAVQEKDYQWIPAIAHAPETSSFGCLFAFYPAGILKADDPLITGTLRHVMEGKISAGGLPVGTGWMKDGIWAAMALDNFAAAYLRMGDRKRASSFLYPVLNHASPLITWCEERGKEPATEVKSGDMQHLWTPLSVVSYTLDALYYEDDVAVHLLAGVPDGWLEGNSEIAVENLVTWNGKCSFKAWNAAHGIDYDIHFERPNSKPIIVGR